MDGGGESRSSSPYHWMSETTRIRVLLNNFSTNYNRQLIHLHNKILLFFEIIELPGFLGFIKI